MKSCLILTVGTGTAGLHSNLAQGLINSLRLFQPDLYWLVPSTSPDSIGVADLIRESVPDGFQAWMADEKYRQIVDHDSIGVCRDTVREIIRSVRHEAGATAKITVNPTSGTKQMSAGATLAALDEGVAGIQFTVGKRHDGVVVTGQERLEEFDPGEVFVGRDLAIAVQLSTAGAHSAARDVLTRHVSLASASEVATCLHEWERQNYEAARVIASRVQALQPYRTQLQTLATELSSGEPSAAIVADIFETAVAANRRAESEVAVFQACKSLELAMRFKLFTATGLSDPFPIAGLQELGLGSDRMNRYRAIAQKNGTCILGLRQIVEVLGVIGDPVSDACQENGRLMAFVRLRNELAHSIKHVHPEEAAEFIALVRELFGAHLPLPPAARRPSLELLYSESAMLLQKSTLV